MQMMTPDEWRTSQFRQNMIVKIEEAIQQCGANMNASELENTVFSKAKHKEEYMSLVTRIIMHIKDKGSKKHGMGPGVMGQPNQPQGSGNMGGPMSGAQGNMGMMSQMNPMTSMNQMGVNVMAQHQQGMVHQMQQNPIVHQMQQGMNQGPGQMIGGLGQQQQNQQSQQQHQMSQPGQGQMMGQNQINLGMNHGQISQMQHIQNAQMGNPQIQQQVQMQNVQIQQALMQGNPQQMMMSGNQQQVMMQSNQPQQSMMGAGQPQMMMQGNTSQQQTMMQANSQAQQGVMSGAPQQQQTMMQGTPQQPQQQQQSMMQGPPQQTQQGNQQQQQQMMQVRGIPNPQIVGNRLMTPQPNVSTAALTALAQVQQQRKVQQQTRPMVSNAMGIPRPEHGTNYSMNRLYYGSNMAQVDNVPVNVQFAGVPGGGQMQQRPVAPFVPSNTSQGMPSPSQPGMSAAGQMPQPQQQSTFVNSPGSQNLMHRPTGPGVNVGGLSPFPNQMVNVPSPNTNLNTPMPVAATPSPRNAEDQACFEKIKELKKYTDLLQRMIARIGNEDMEKSSKMKKLLEILTSPNQRVSMEILLKCEAALKKMERQQHDTGGVLAPSSSSAPASQPKDQTSPFQQIQDAVLSALKNGSSSHTYQRTFRQSVETLTGQPFAATPDATDTEAELHYENELSLDIPGVLRRELKIIDNRFKVKLIKNPRSPLNLIVHVSLTDPRLPRVPPLKIFVPHDYPDESPTVLDLRSEYGTTVFLNSVARTLKARMLSLTNRYTVLELLQCWEMSVRQVSNPHYKATAHARMMLSSNLARAFL